MGSGMKGWEGHLNWSIKSPKSGSVDYLLDCVRFWIDTFDIDGLRLDVAYCLDREFMKRLRQFTQELKPDLP